MATSVTLKPNAIDISGSTSGTTTLQASAVAGTTTLTLPAATDTLVGKATTDTLTNKTLTTPSVSSPTISDGTANGVAYLNGSKVLTTGSALVFDGSNLGLGVTPPTSTDAGNITIKGGSTLNFSTASGNMAANATFNSGWKYIATAAAVKYTQSGAEHQWFNAASGTAGNAITFTQAMTLDASGNLGIGQTSMASDTRLHLTKTTDNCIAKIQSSYGAILQLINGGGSEVSTINATGNNVLTLQTGSTERARIDSSGNLLVGTNGQTNLERLGVVFTGNNEGAYFANGSASPTGSGITVNFSNATGTNGTACILYKGRTAGADRFYVYGNGNVVNTNNSYGSLSDIKHKENIVDATPKLEKLNQVRVVNFNIKGDSQKQIGVIAQELEQVFPSMVDESPDRDAEGNDLGTTTKSVKYSVFVPILIKAIQEQQALITQLTARITALEGA